MDIEIFDGNFSLSDYPGHPDYSIPLDYPEQSENTIKDLSVDYHELIERKT